MNQLPLNPLENTAAVFHQVATGENRRRSRYIKLENGKDVFTNNRRERTDLRVIFDDAQKQIQDALLSVTEDSIESTLASLASIEQDTQIIIERYERRAGNIFVRMGLINPRARGETVISASHLHLQAVRAQDILKTNRNPGLYRRVSNLELILRSLCRNDPTYIFEFLQLSGKGGKFEFCHKELEEIATEQFKSLFQCIRDMDDFNDCVFELGKWILKRMPQLTPEMVAQRDKRLSNQFFDYLPYINYRSIRRDPRGRSFRASPFRADVPLGKLWVHLSEYPFVRRTAYDFQRIAAPTQDQLPIWLKLARDLFTDPVHLRHMYLSLVPSDGSRKFYDELDDSLTSVQNFNPFNPLNSLEALYALADTGLMKLEEFREAARLTGDPYTYFFDGIEPPPEADCLLRVLCLILKENDFPNRANIAAVTSKVKDIHSIYGLELRIGNVPKDYRFNKLCKLLQKEWLAQPQYIALLDDDMMITRAILTDAELNDEEYSDSQKAIVEVYRALQRNEIKRPKEAQEILQGIFRLQNAYESDEDDLKKFFGEFSSAHKEISKLLEPFSDEHPFKRLMSAPPPPEGITLEYKVKAFILGKIASGEMQDIDETERLFEDVIALSELNQKLNAKQCTDDDYKNLLLIARSDIAKNEELVDLLGEDVPLLRVFSDPDHAPFASSFEVKVLALALKAGASDEILYLRHLSAFEVAAEVSFRLWDFDSNEALLSLVKLRRQLGDRNDPLSQDLQILFPRACKFSRLVNSPAKEGEHFAVSAMRFCLEQAEDASWNTLGECILFMQDVFLDNTNRDAVRDLIPKIDEMRPSVLKFLDEKLPFIVYAMKVKKRTPENSCGKNTPIDDLILWGRDLAEYRSESGNFPFEEHCLARGFDSPFKVLSNFGDDYFRDKEDLLAEELSTLDLGKTAISPEYALELQEKYGPFAYNDNYTVQKRLFQNENSGDCTAIVNGKKRKLHSQLIQRALPGIEVVDTEAGTLKLPEKLSPEELNAFLEYCYTGFIAYASDALLMSLYNKAELMGSEPLQGYCSSVLLGTVTKDNVLRRYDEACQMGVLPLKQHCVRFLQAHYYRFREHFSEDKKRQIAEIVTTFFDPPVVTPQPVALAPVIWEPNFTLKGKDGKEVQINLELMIERSNLFKKMGEDIDLEHDLKELEVKLFDSQTLSYIAQFVANGRLPGNLSRDDLILLRQAADYFDMPMLEFRINELLGPRS